jgi:hypothetical protein
VCLRPRLPHLRGTHPREHDEHNFLCQMCSTENQAKKFRASRSQLVVVDVEHVVHVLGGNGLPSERGGGQRGHSRRLLLRGPSAHASATASSPPPSAPSSSRQP